MSRFKIDDFPEAVQAQIRAQLADHSRPVAKPSTQVTPAKPCPPRGAQGPNKGELEYKAIYLRGQDARYEALTFRMENGHKYTPDWVVFQDGLPVACHECKGSYALGSHQRAKLAFDQAAIEFAGLQWTWARKTSNGWDVHVIETTPTPRLGSSLRGREGQVPTATLLSHNGILTKTPTQHT